MLDLIYLSPVFLVLIGTFITRYGIRKTPFSWRCWALSVFLFIGSIFLPLTQGVWIFDFSGKPRLIAKASYDEYRFEVVQYWNHVDFYTIELLVIQPDGTIKRNIINEDSKRSRIAAIAFDSKRRIATVSVYDMIYPLEVSWP